MAAAVLGRADHSARGGRDLYRPQPRLTRDYSAGSAEASERALETAGIDPMTRGEALQLDDFVRIAEALA